MMQKRMKLNASQYWTYGLLLAVILLFALIRFHLRQCPLERDEGEYAYAGQLMLQGIPPYQLAYSMKLPGTFAAYSVILALFGQTPGGIHLGLLLVNAATTFLVFLWQRCAAWIGLPDEAAWDLVCRFRRPVSG